MAVRQIVLRYDTTANWESENPILAEGEPGVELDGGIVRLKLGDGETAWNTLNYISSTEAGASAYQIAVAEGFVGDEEAWLESLVGAQGEEGDPGEQGDPGTDGDSAYEIAVDEGFVGTQSEWLESLQGETGEDGADGTNGQGVPTGGSTNQYLKKDSSSDYDTSWATMPDFVNVASGIRVVEHGATAGTARPTAAVVYWLGSVEPTNAVVGDLIYVGGDL